MDQLWSCSMCYELLYGLPYKKSSIIESKAPTYSSEARFSALLPCSMEFVDLFVGFSGLLPSA